MTKEEKRGWAMGAIFVLGTLAYDYRQEDIAKQIWDETGIDLEEARFCAEFDVAKLRTVVPDLPKGEE